MDMARRHAIGALMGASIGSLAVLSGCTGQGDAPAPSFANVQALETALKDVEARSGGRLGVTVLDSASGARFGLRSNERFGMCSTFKLALAAVTLREVASGLLDPKQIHPFSAEDRDMAWEDTLPLLVDGGMTVLTMAETTQKTSDNACANVLLRLLGGPPGFTAQLRALGDGVTRLDRFETDMNLVHRGDVRDTTTPDAMAALMRNLLVGSLLDPKSQATLIQWMVDTKTGTKRLRAGFPAGWRAGDKTGTGIAAPSHNMANKYNDVAIVFPPNRSPIIVTSYFEASGYFPDIRDEDQAVLAAVGSLVTQALAPTV